MDPLHAVYLTVGLFVTNMGTFNGLGGDCARINYLASLS
ncbi:Uncharacterised protein [Shigella sonnei]|nr:Uncharacterised protein [Shigella sonnei]